MRNSLLILLLLPLTVFGQYFERVPNTTTFTLQNVIDVVDPSSNDLNECFTDADANGFNSSYKSTYYSSYGNKNNLLMFRDYCKRPSTFTNMLSLYYSIRLSSSGGYWNYTSSSDDAMKAAKMWYFGSLVGYTTGMGMQGMIRYVRTYDNGDTILISDVGCSLNSLTGYYLVISDFQNNPLTVFQTSSTIVEKSAAPTYDVMYSGGSSGNWECPAGVDTIVVECIGGGGAGGGARGNPSSGGGGAGGAYSRKMFVVTPGEFYSFQVGTGATGSIFNGATGGTTWFYENGANGCVAEGGAGGVSPTSNFSYGAAGTGSSASSVGTVKYAGGSGSNGTSSYGGAGGSSGRRSYAGATSVAGSGSTGGSSGTYPTSYGANGQTTNSTDGIDASAGYGSGGGGAKANTNTDRSGGDGRSGILLIHYF